MRSELTLRLAERIADQLVKAAPGHCMRVDHLPLEQAVEVCRLVRERVAGAAQVHVLTRDQRQEDSIFILPEHAVELRNKKAQRLCLFVPPGTIHGALGSLNNAFARFELVAFLRDLQSQLLHELPGDVARFARRVVEHVRRQRAHALATDDDIVDYLLCLHQQPTLSEAARQLWRVALLPDLEPEGALGRLERNSVTVRLLARPAKATSSLAERLESCGLGKSTFGKRLARFLSTQPLHEPRRWLQAIAEEHPEFAFDRWPVAGGTELERVEVVPFVDERGRLTSCGLRWAEAPGDPLIAPKDGQVKIAWQTVPRDAPGVRRWRLELRLHDPEDQAELEDVELPVRHTKSRARRARFSLRDLDERLVGKCCEIHVIPLDEQGLPMASGNAPLVGISEPFWIGEELAQPKRPVIRTHPNAWFGHVATVVDGAPPVTEQTGWQTAWNGSILTCRVGEDRSFRVWWPLALVKLERQTLQAPEQFLRFAAEVDLSAAATSPAEPEIKSHPARRLPTWPYGEALRAARAAFFEAIRSRGPDGLGTLGAVLVDEALRDACLDYAKAYREALYQPCDEELRDELLALDTLRLEVHDRRERQCVLIFLPTHPLVALWLVAYARLLQQWATELGRLEPKQRHARLDLDLLRQLQPHHLPYAAGSGERRFVSAGVLAFCYPVAVEEGARDPSHLLAAVARALGAAEEEPYGPEDLAARLREELDAYLRAHPYTQHLRLNFVNPGDGRLCAEMLQGWAERWIGEPESAELATVPRIELLLHDEQPATEAVSRLEALQDALYRDLSLRPPSSHLTPLFEFAVRRRSELTKLPGGPAHLAFLMDYYRPRLVADQPAAGETAVALYGLIARPVVRFSADESHVVWQHRLAIPEQLDPAEAHPDDPRLSQELLELHAAYLRCVLGAASGNLVAANEVRLEPDDVHTLELLHHQADWVVTIDRAVSVELFDSPEDAYIGPLSRKYVLDHVPEFGDGLVTRLLVTTSRVDEVRRILQAACDDLGFSAEHCAEYLFQALRMLSGRFALRALSDVRAAREAVALAATVLYLLQTGELHNAILVPVDYHTELFGRARRRDTGVGNRRCDMVCVRLQEGGLQWQLIEVKSRPVQTAARELLRVMKEQLDVTEQALRALFLTPHDRRRVDHWLQRASIAHLLRYYVARAVRYRLIATEEDRQQWEQTVRRFAAQEVPCAFTKRGFIVSLRDRPRGFTFNDVHVRFLSAGDFADAGLATKVATVEQLGVLPIEATPERTPPPHDEEPTPQQEPSPPLQPPPSEEQSTRAYRISDRTTRPTDTPPPKATEQPAVATTEQSEPAERPVPPSPARTGAEPTAVRISLGRSLLEGTELVWQPSVTGSPHLFILGIPGQGKSVTTTRLAVQLTRQGVPCLVFDYHGEFASPDHALRRLTDARVLRADQPLPFSVLEPLDSSGPNGWKLECLALRDIIGYVCKLGQIQGDLLYRALAQAFANHTVDGKLQELPTLQEVWQLIQEQASDVSGKNLVARCRKLFEFQLFAERPEPGSFDRLMQQTTILDLSPLRDDELQLAAGAFTLRRVYKAILGWPKQRALKLALILDEAHRLAKDTTLPKIMKEGRKFGVVVVATSQNVHDFHPEVLGNAGTKIVFRTNFPDSKRVASLVGSGRELVGVIERLDVGHALVALPGQTPQHARMYRPSQ